jgi:hypothetical protein
MRRRYNTPPTPSPPPSHELWEGAQVSPQDSYDSNFPSPDQLSFAERLGMVPDVGFEVARHVQPQQEPQPHMGMADQVHNVFENIKVNYETIIQEFGGRIYLNILPNVPDILISGLDLFFAQIIAKRDNTPLNSGPEYGKIVEILNRLWWAKNEYLEGQSGNDIFTWVQFVMRQSDTFQFHYITCFIKDTYFAYNDGNTLSCVRGIHERLLLSIADACILYCTQNQKPIKTKNTTYKKAKAKARKKMKKTAKTVVKSARKNMIGGALSKTCDNPIYRKLIRLFKKEVPDMNDLTKEWAVIFTGGLADSLNTSQIKKSFIDFMERKYTLYGIENSVAIQIRADSFDEIFERREF